MKMVPNAFYVYVSDMERSSAFYQTLFDLKAIFASPQYVAYEIALGTTFALWSREGVSLEENPVRTSEMGLNISLSAEEVDSLHELWLAKGATTVEAPHDDVFGRTFVVADPDGNLIRVAPVD